MQHYRQGDVLIRRIVNGNVPSKRQSVEPVLALGEVTGHSHRVEGEGVLAYARNDSPTRLAEWVVVPEGGTATVVHEEHGAIALPEGTYEVIQQREFTGDERAFRAVYD